MIRISLFVFAFFVALTIASISYAGTWVEDFERGNYDSWRLLFGTDKDRADIKVVNGELVFKKFNVGLLGDYIALEASRDWWDYVMELRFKFGELGPGTTRGIIISYNESFQGVPEGGPNCPFAFISPPFEFRPEIDGTVMGLVGKKGSYSTITSAAFHFEQNKWYNIKIIVNNSHYEVFVDEKKSIAYDDNTFTKGGIGIGARDVITYFDDIRVTGDSVPDNMTSSVRLSGKAVITWAMLKQKGE